MKRRIAIVDDEALARARIRSLLESDGLKYEILECEDGFQALELIPGFAPEVVFLDIEMPELSGFDVLRNLGQRNFKLVFQTAYDQFALKAFEVNACDYILKPFTDERFNESLERALGKSPGAHNLEEKKVTNLNKYLVKEKVYLERYVIRVGAKSKVIEENEVIYFLSESHTTRIFTDKIDFSYSLSLEELEQKLNPDKFFRIHRNCIVKTNQINSFRHGGNMEVTLKNETVLQASREKGKALKRLLIQK